MPSLGVNIQGLRNPKELNPTQLYRRECFDEIVEISEGEVLKTFEVVRKTAKEEGLLVGITSGAVLYVALRKAKELGKDKKIVAVLPDSGEKYLSTTLFQS
jgi:cysteine synthase A